MSYRNPQQVVDTQSAQHIANLQNVISGTIQKVGTSYKADEDKRVAEEKAKAKERAKRIDGYIKTEQGVWTSTEKTTQNNKSLTYEGLDTRIDEYSDISDKIDSGLLYGKELANARAYQRDILSLPGRIKNVTELYTEGVVGYDKAIRNQGSQGGVDMWSDSAVDNLAVWQDKAPGTRKIFLNKNEKSGRLEVNLSITPEGGKERIYTESQLQEMSKNGGPMPLIPDETKDFEEAKAEYFYEIDNTTKKSVHKDGILGEEESREIKNKKGVVTAIQYYRPVDKEKAKLASRAMAKLNVETMEPFNGAMFANNVLGFGGTKDQVTEKNYEEKWPEITDAYNDYLVNNYTDELKVRTEKVETPKTKEGPIQTGKDFYDQLRKNPISYLKEYTGVDAKYDEDNNTITIKAEDRQDADVDLIINMNNPDSRISFYTKLLEQSRIAKGDSKESKLVRKQFSDALRAGTAKKLKPKAKKKLPTD